MTPAELNELVRTKQKVVMGLFCSKCGIEGVGFQCVKCEKMFCPAHAYNTAGHCPDCPLWVSE